MGFITPSVPFAERWKIIMKEKNLEILRKWHKAAARAENLEQFLEKSEIKNLI